jgi:uncharacterized membrane protein YgaE (UPF0421/DUF939 family)
MEWNNAIEARAACDSLLIELGQIPHNPDLKRFLRNIDAQVTELSRKEVIARRHRTNDILKEDLEKINNSLNYLRNLILVARLVE